MRTITSAMSCRRTARLVPTVLPPGLLACVSLVVVLCVSGPAWATDYRAGGTCAGKSTMGHVRVEYAKAAGTVEVDVSECAGDTGCCCTDDCTHCNSVDILGQECDGDPGCSGYCPECCHHKEYDNCTHQSCCSVDGSPEICCISGAPACDVKATAVTIRSGSSCSVQGPYVATICDDLVTGKECPAAGQRIEATLTVGDGIGKADYDLTVGDLMDMHNGLLSIYVEFQGGGVAVAPITNDGPKDNPLFPVAALTLWGMITLALLLATGGIVLMRQHRPKLA